VIPRSRIALGILAGGRGSRLGGADKASLEFRGERLLERALRAAGTGYAQRLLSHPAAGRDWGVPGLEALADLRPGYPGPLAGLETLLEHCRQDWLLTLPVDLRDPVPGLCERLAGAAAERGATLRDGEGAQPLYSLWPVPAARIVVSRALDRGDYAVHRVVAELGLTEVDVSPLRLGNLNTPDDFATTT
jgi:molybdopterin-guanine dinucleotide biosynthesis protein A